MTNILATIGTSTESIKSLKELNKFTNCFRLNLSHNSLSWHKKISKRIKKNFKHSTILIDLPGVKPRTSNNKDIVIKKNQLVKFFYEKKEEESKILSIQLTNQLPKSNKRNLTLSDGKYYFSIKKRTNNSIICKSHETFLLKPRQGLNMPMSKYDDRLQIKKYLTYLRKIENQVYFDAIGLSFIQSDEVIHFLKKKYPNLLIISKIENYYGLRNCIKIVKSSDAVMIDRGDLQAETGQFKLFENVNKIVNTCNEFGKPIIMATDNLGSMKNSIIPSKGDIISIGFAKQMNVDTIMLSEETAIFKNYLKIIKTLKKILSKKNPNIKKNNNASIESIIWKSLSGISKENIVLFSKKGYAIEKIRTMNSSANLIVFTDSKKTFNQSKFRFNCKTILIPRFNNNSLENFIKKYLKIYKKYIFDKYEKAILLRVSYPKTGARANTLTLLDSKNIL